MADKLHEQLSALVDNECAAHELELALRRLTKEPELANCWQRYQLLSDTLRNQLPQTVSVDFSNRVRVAIEQDAASAPLAVAPTQAQFNDGSSTEWRRPLMGLARRCRRLHPLIQ